MAKRGPTIQYKWARRWCELTPTQLNYYVDQERRVQKGVIPVTLGMRVFGLCLPNTDACNPEAPGEAKVHFAEKPYGFVVDAEQGEDQPRHLFYFDAGSQAALESWIAAIAHTASVAQKDAVASVSRSIGVHASSAAALGGDTESPTRECQASAQVVYSVAEMLEQEISSRVELAVHRNHAEDVWDVEVETVCEEVEDAEGRRVMHHTSVEAVAVQQVTLADFKTSFGSLRCSMPNVPSEKALWSPEALPASESVIC